MKTRTTILAALAMTFAACGTAFAQSAAAGPDTEQSVPLTPEFKAELMSRLDDVVMKNAFVPGIDFSQWPTVKAKFQSRIDAAKTPEQLSGAVNAALNAFKASHFVFNTPQSARSFTRQTGVGIGIIPELTPEGIRILEVFAKSPAEEAGLRVGDVILSANGVKPTAITSLRGEAGTKLKIKVRTAGGVEREIELTRREFSTARPEVTRWLVPNDVAYIQIPSFMTYDPKNVEKLMTGVQGSKALVVDLRSNGGGRVDLLRHLCGFFMQKEQAIGTFITRSLVDYYVKDTQGSPTDLLGIARYAQSRKPGFLITPTPVQPTIYKGKVIVLINAGTGSASEMFASGARDTFGAKIIGSK
ncbi:MAG: PDZ domain-containing protein, partial [Chthonomonas sp.]|nr:PDZ domain-containing protein [Chthonomonas sp.]